MSYIHCRTLSLLLPPSPLNRTISGDASVGAYTSGHVWATRITNNAGTPTVALFYTIPLYQIGNNDVQFGSYLKSLDVIYRLSATVTGTLTLELFRQHLAADGSALTCDLWDDLALEINQGTWKKNLPITGPLWSGIEGFFYAKFTSQVDAVSTVDLVAIRANFELRI